MARMRVEGRLQYQLAGGAAADAWLTTWVATHGDDIREHEGNGHSLAALVPPHEEGCVSELTLEYHLEADTVGELNDLRDEITAAIYQGGVAEAECDSWYSHSSE